MKITASTIRSAMAKTWAAPEYAIMWEVSEGTGAAGGRRRADAIMMSLWPSRGLELHGVEIKVSRSDWKREAADPTKAELIAQFCDRWWVHTSPGVVDDLSCLPPAWGLREFDGKSWKTIREAEKTEAAPVTRPFLAAMLRRADETMRSLVREAASEGASLVEAERQRLRDRHAEDLEHAVNRRTEKLQREAKGVAEFKAAFGDESLDNFLVDNARLGRAALALQECEVRYGGPDKLAKRLRDAADAIDFAADLLRTPEAEASQ